MSAYLLRWSLTNFLPGVASNHNPPDFHLPSSWDYRCESLHSATFDILRNLHRHGAQIKEKTSNKTETGGPVFYFLCCLIHRAEQLRGRKGALVQGQGSEFCPGYCCAP
jgi:hypothetical protein